VVVDFGQLLLTVDLTSPSPLIKTKKKKKRKRKIKTD
jgi:hypothetical protein